MVDLLLGERVIEWTTTTEIEKVLELVRRVKVASLSGNLGGTVPVFEEFPVRAPSAGMTPTHESLVSHESQQEVAVDSLHLTASD